MDQVEKLRQISPNEFVLLGMQNLAYVKRVVVDDTPAYAVFAADGTQVATVADRDAAFVLVRQHEMEPVSVH